MFFFSYLRTARILIQGSGEGFLTFISAFVEVSFMNLMEENKPEVRDYQYKYQVDKPNLPLSGFFEISDVRYRN